MGHRLFGLETEYAVSAFYSTGARIDQAAALKRFFHTARSDLVCLPGIDSNGVFLANGSRLYADCQKVELATCEVTDPWELCRYVKAGDEMVAHIARRVATDSDLREVIVSRHNVSYGGSPTTWGSHFSVSHRVPPAQLPQQLIPYIISRVIFSGAGGFDNRAAGIQFMVSPRVAHLTRVVSPDSTSERGIFHTKDEPLCAGYHRLHILTGESLCSETSIWLTHATCVLVVSLIEAGCQPGKAFSFDAPLAVMRTFATDTNCNTKIPDRGGRHWTAVDIQRHYLQLAEEHLGHPALPDWAEVACIKWRAMLERLEADPQSARSTLDWAIKLALVMRHAANRSISWEAIPRWNRVLTIIRVERESDLAGPTNSGDSSPDSLIEWAEPVCQRFDLDPAQLPIVMQLQQELYELDARFSELSQRGIFGSLDRSGVLTHRIDGVSRGRAGWTTPPAIGRPHLRGRCVRRFWRRRNVYCNWSYVIDRGHNRYLDLSDPYAIEEKWTDTPPEL